jgi:imidazolonepropionase-like amidohydrolase
MTYKNIRIPGIDGKCFDVSVRGGRFVSITEVPCHDEAGLWMSPGLIDLHTHLGWTDFYPEDQAKRSAAEIEALQAHAFELTLQGGVTTVRDAGGLLPDAAERIRRKHPLRVYPCGAMLGAEDAGGNPAQRVRGITGWVKILATGGLGTPTEAVLDPLFSREEFFSIVQSAHSGGVKVMVHAWGGPAIDWAIEAGADSVEHGVYLTQDQARGLARKKIAFVPTAAIYRIAAGGSLALDESVRIRAARAACAHPQAIAYAKEAGVRIAFGTDFAAPLHGRNFEEIDALADCALTRREAWNAATEEAAAVLGCSDSLGRIAEGFIADAVLFAADPYSAQNAKALRAYSIKTI